MSNDQQTMSHHSPPLRILALILGGMFISLLILALAPLLLRQTAHSLDTPSPIAVRLIPPIPEQIITPPEPLQEPEPPPPPELVQPELDMPPQELPELIPPDLELPDLQPESPNLDPPDLAPLPPLTPRIDMPALSQVALSSLPLQSSPLQLQVQLEVAKAPAPRAMPRPPPQPPAPTRFNLNEVDRHPEAVSNMPPVYPFQARRSGVEGQVRIRFLVDAAGAVQELRIVEAQPEGIFERAVEQTIPRWRFKPGQKDGRTVETWVETTIRFQLEGRS